jgi:hypothetical protein
MGESIQNARIKAKRYSSKRPLEVEEKCKWRLYHNNAMIRAV